MTKQRNSSFEVIRIICILYVVYWHSIGPFLDDMASFNLFPAAIINSMCNNTNTLFMLLSGYFGIRLNLEKLIKLDLAIIFYDILNLILINGITAKALISSCMPIIFKNHWFLSCYFAIAILSPFLNKIPEKLERKTFRNLLLVLILIFYLIPTVFFSELIEDGGKGIVCMCIVYLVGRYIKLYYQDISFRKAPLFLFWIFCIVFSAVLNTIHSIFSGVFMGMYCRDNSIFMLFASASFLLIFREIHFTSQFINKITPNIVILYCIEGYVRAFVSRYFNLGDYSYSPYFIGVVFIYSIAIIVLCLLINEFRVLLLGKVDSFLARHIFHLYTAAANRARIIAARFQSGMLRFLTKQP